MKNLADFKKVLTSCLNHKIEIKSKVVSKQGETIKENDFTTVGHIQTNAFAMNRNGTLSWCEYGKAKDWTFKGATAEKQFMDGGKLVFEIKNPEFFGL